MVFLYARYTHTHIILKTNLSAVVISGNTQLMEGRDQIAQGSAIAGEGSSF